MSEEFEIDRVNWIGEGADVETQVVNVKIRYSHPGTPATLTPLDDGRARIVLHEPQKAVTPGQAAVFYVGDVLVGGGWICRSQALAPAIL